MNTKIKTSKAIDALRQIPEISLTFCSDYFKCGNCGYAELRKVIGDISYTACPKCGTSPMYRVK